MNYPKCTLASIITPGTYCVVSKEEEHMNEVKQLENCLAAEIQNSSLRDFSLKCEMCIAVKTPDGRIKRGVIEEKLSNYEQYKIFLIDYGQTLVTDKSKIYLITNEAHLNVEPLSFIVKLFGIFPSRFYVIDGIRKAKVTQTWLPQAEVFVEDLFSRNLEVIVQSIFIKKRTVFGDIFLEIEPNKYTSLRKMLCKNEFCAYSKTSYLRHEGLDLPSNDTSELDTKMEFVKKWQRESFKKFQGLPFSISPSIGRLGFFPESHSDKDKSEQKSETIKSLSGHSGKHISGRGKMKLLLSQMKDLQVTSSSDADSSALESSLGIRSTSGLLGKKKFIEQLEMKKRSKLKNKSPFPKLDSKVDDDGRFDDADLPTVSQKMENSVVKAGECSLISDDNLTENSMEDNPPPLIRNNPVDIEFIEQTERKENTEIKTNFTKSNGSENNSSEIKIFKLREDENWLSVRQESRFNLGVPSKLSSRNYWSPFVVFGDSVVRPVNTFRELPIQFSIIRNLEKVDSFIELSQIQRWAIPAIRKQHNTVIIGSSKTGKTLSYLVPLIDYVQDEFYFEELPEGNGPTVIIVASSSCVCESIYYMCHSLLGNILAKNIFGSKIRVVLAHGNGCEKEVWAKLTNGCEILISTPHCLARLLEYPVLTNLERLTCLVLDEVDVITQKHFRKQVMILLEKAKLSTKNRHYQKIFCGEKWTPNVENIVKKYAETYALIIGSYLEAVIYERIKPTIYLVLQHRKAETLLEKIKDKVGKMKILVVCESVKDAIFVDKFLTEKKISSLAAHEGVMCDNLKEIGNTWRACPNLVLVITDGVLSEIKIREAQVLIHYGLPDKSKTNFFLRYSAFENFVRETSHVQHNIQNKSHFSKLIDIIIVDDENHLQLPHIVDFVVRLGGKVSEKVRKKCEEIRRLIEVSKTNTLICRNLLTFGRCRDSKSCFQRHALIKSLDSPGNLPSSGWVNFTVIKVHTASYMSVRLFEHVDANKKVSKLNDRFLEIPIKLAEVFKAEENRRPHGRPSLGDICAVKSEALGQEVFYRAQVVEYLKMDSHGTPVAVNLRLLDQGEIWSRKNIELYELPKELAEYPPVAIDVRIVGIQPLDFDVSWSQIANIYVKDVLTQTLEENQYWSGKIVLALNGILFLDPVKRKQFLPHLDTHVFDLVLQEHLINNRVAVKNEEHLPLLVKLCLEGEIEVPKKEEVKRKDIARIQPQWAFFDSDFVEVNFLAASDTSSFFLRSKKFEKLLDELETDCQSEGERVTKEMSLKTKKFLPFGLTIGSFCLAKFENGKWNRGRIERETENSFDIFFVDHGDFLSVPKIDVVPISQSLLLRLPCQSIECSLIGISEKPECSVEVLHEIYEFSNDGKSHLYALIIGKTKSEFTSGRKYSLNLLNQRGVSLNKSLVLSGKVPAKESERQYLEDIEFILEKEEEEGKEEEEEEEEEDEPEQKIVGEATEEISVKNYLEELEDDVFKNEEGLAFLKEVRTAAGGEIGI